MRTANIVRKTSETDVTVELNLDGNKKRVYQGYSNKYSNNFIEIL